MARPIRSFSSAKPEYSTNYSNQSTHHSSIINYTNGDHNIHIYPPVVTGGHFPPPPQNSSQQSQSPTISFSNIPTKKRKLNRDLSCIKITGQVGSGMYGTVFKAIDNSTGEKVALKCIKISKENEGFPVTAVREIKLLKAMNHENIIGLHEILTYSRSQELIDSGNTPYSFDDGAVFMVFEYMDFDLSGLFTNTKMVWTPDHIKCYARQLLSGLCYMHQHNILHRDIKGANILVSRDNRLKIADWGLARSFYSRMQKLTNNVVTIWYRCPELLLETKYYGTEIDIWAFGCLFGEMFGRRQPILPSRPPNPSNQLELIYQLCGTPTGETEERLKRCDGWEKYQFTTIYEPKLREKYMAFISPSGVDLLERLLCLNPDQRITAERALNHEYFITDGGTLTPDRLPRIPDFVEDIHEYDIQKKKTDDDGTKRLPAPIESQSSRTNPPTTSNAPPNSGGQNHRGRSGQIATSAALLQSLLPSDPRARYRSGRPPSSSQPPIQSNNIRK